MFDTNDKAVFAQSNSVLALKNTIFSDNNGLSGSAIVEIIYSKLTCEGCQFTNNREKALLVSSYSSCDVKNSVFSNNFTPNKGSAITLNTNSALCNISDTSFDSNFAIKGGTLNFIDTQVQVTNISMSNNYSKTMGPGILLNSANATITDSYFFNHSTTSSGAFIYAMTLSNVDIYKSDFISGESSGGGALMFSASILNFYNSVVKDCSSTVNSAGIYAISQSEIHIYNSEFSNLITESPSDRGFIKIEQGSISIQDSLFDAMLSGCIYGQYVTSFTVQNCSFNYGESASGSAIYLSDVKEVYILNSTFSNLTASAYGGAVFIEQVI